MIRKVIVWSCVAALAIASAQPAHATLITEESGEYAVVTGVWGPYLAQPDEFGPLYTPVYWQLMVIDGAPTIVFTTYVYPTGREELYLQQTWNGYNEYGLGDCEC